MLIPCPGNVVKGPSTPYQGPPHVSLAADESFIARLPELSLARQLEVALDLFDLPLSPLMQNTRKESSGPLVPSA